MSNTLMKMPHIDQSVTKKNAPYRENKEILSIKFQGLNTLKNCQDPEDIIQNLNTASNISLLKYKICKKNNNIRLSSKIISLLFPITKDFQNSHHNSDRFLHQPHLSLFHPKKMK
jgi:hypothetical protein